MKEIATIKSIAIGICAFAFFSVPALGYEIIKDKQGNFRMLFIDKDTDGEAKSPPVKASISKATVCMQAGNYAAAVTYFDKAIADGAAKETHDQVFCLRADAYERSKQYEKAIADYSEYGQGCPADYMTILRIAHCNCELKRYEKALAGCEQVLALAPNLTQAIYLSGKTLYQQGKYKEALPDLKHCCESANSAYLLENEQTEVKHMKSIAEKKTI